MEEKKKRRGKGRKRELGNIIINTMGPQGRSQKSEEAKERSCAKVQADLRCPWDSRMVMWSLDQRVQVPVTVALGVQGCI